MEVQRGQFAEGPLPTTSLYTRVGGIPYFKALVESFYAKVEADPILRPLYRRTWNRARTTWLCS